MKFSVIMVFISCIELYIGMRTIKEENKARGVAQLVLTFLAPIITILFCSKKTDFVFGGTD